MPSIPDIPISLIVNGRLELWIFSRVNGAGSSLNFQVYSKSRYIGQFFFQQTEWRLYLYGEKYHHPESQYFADYIAAYLDGVMTTADW